MANRARYDYAWVEATELNPFRGEPVAVTAHRRPHNQYTREPFPAATLSHISGWVLTALRGRFDGWWWQLWQNRNHNSTETIRRHEARAAWYREQQFLHELLSDHGAPDAVRPLRDSGPNIVTPDGLDRAVAEIVVDGERLGWICALHGEIIPTREWPR